MGTKERRAREKEARRQLILTAAKRMLSEKGSMQMSMEDVALVAELSTGTLYLYFKGKNEILATLLLNSIRYLNVRLKRISDQDGVTLEEKMKHLKNTLTDLLAFDPWIFHKIIHLHSFKNVEKLSFSLLEEVKVGYRQTFYLMTEIFRKNQAVGNALSAGPEHCADFICSIFLGSICHVKSQLCSADDRDSLQQLLEGAFEIFVNGMLDGGSQKIGERVCA